MPKAILLDLDDTIVAYSAPIGGLWRDACERYAAASGGEAQALNRAIRETGRWFWDDPERHRRWRQDMQGARREVVRLAFEQLGLDPSGVEALADDYSRHRRETLELFPGASGALSSLKAAGVKLALVSNGEAKLQREKVERFSLAPYFAVIMLEGEHDFGKPDHRMFTVPLEEMGVGATDAWMVGDSLTYDIAPAKELGIFSVWNDWKGKGLPEGRGVKPDRTIGSIVELASGK